MTNILYVRTPVQKEIFEKELQGQLSDGYWENVKTDERLWFCDVRVAKKDEKVGCTFKARYFVDFSDSDMIDVVGDSMVDYAKKISSSYNETKLIDDLIELTDIVFKKEKVVNLDKKVANRIAKAIGEIEDCVQVMDEAVDWNLYRQTCYTLRALLGADGYIVTKTSAGYHAEKAY
jgi:hypothetical protein